MSHRIQSKSDYLAFLEADLRSLGHQPTWRQWVINDIWRFQRSLRRVEYLRNCPSLFRTSFFARLRFRRLSTKYGFSIPPNTFGPGLAIVHVGNIIVNPHARIGANCRIHVGVNIGTSAGSPDAAPTLGDNCYIGPGAKIFGSIHMGSGVAIGANSVVNKSFTGDGISLGGIPARVISSKGSHGLLKQGFLT